MLKRYFVLGIMLFAAIGLISCSDDDGDSNPADSSTNPLAGVWFLQKVLLLEPEEIEFFPSNAGVQVTFNLNDDGSYEVTTTSLAGTTTDAGSWTSTETTITFDSDTEGTPNLTINYTKDGDEITATGAFNFSPSPDSQPINATITLAKDPPGQVQISLNTSEQLIAGSWNMEQIDVDQNGQIVTINAVPGVLTAAISFAENKTFFLTISSPQGDNIVGGLWSATSTDLIIIDARFVVQVDSYELLENNLVIKFSFPYNDGTNDFPAVWTFRKQ